MDQQAWADRKIIWKDMYPAHLQINVSQPPDKVAVLRDWLQLATDGNLTFCRLLGPWYLQVHRFVPALVC
jgi:hypothetical protein